MEQRPFGKTGEIFPILSFGTQSIVDDHGCSEEEAVLWIATKAWARDARITGKQLEESLRRLRTDHIDEWRMHNVRSIEELGKITSPLLFIMSICTNIPKN
jgi:aryl-alcohol dehydrogenase-like predicted oxidoreductase